MDKIKCVFEFISNYKGVSDYRVEVYTNEKNSIRTLLDSYRLHLNTETRTVRKTANEKIDPEILDLFNDFLESRYTGQIAQLAKKYPELVNPEPYIPVTEEKI